MNRIEGMRVRIIYWLVNRLHNSAKWLEANCWGYEWCSKCNGESICPNSGMREQPDGYHLCPRCRGHRWEHVAKAFDEMKNKYVDK